MATTKDYKDFVLDKLSLLENITCKTMMGEYLLYYNQILFGGIYDNRFLVKMVNGNKRYHMQEVIPYDGAKPMYLVEEIDDPNRVKEIIIDTCKDLLVKNNKKQSHK
ncbi:MAG: hypothetical protein Q4D02_02555 [Clostridia bacterium]|nr:hypothetical protein [Clostridia bacterium]